jgi:TPR repeat protein
MRISERLLAVVLFGAGLGLATAFAFDGTRTPGDVAPAVGLDIVPRGNSASAMNGGALHAPGQVPLTSVQAFQSGTQLLRNGDTKAAVSALEYAAANGHPGATWKLGRMYADGDGVERSDLRAFEYFRAIADAHADEPPGTPQARFVASAFVALGNYYLDGIAGSTVKADADRAREMYAYAASYFGDPDAQYHLGRLYLDGMGGLREPKQAARWLSLAANKGQYEAQAVFGAMLFKGEYVARQASRGLMWLTLARDAAPQRESWIAELYAAALKQATADERAIALVYLERWLNRRND